ncbi:ABC transporter ATP-binding protein [Rhodospirillaceae bacterium SYSU D60014]|uniref:ABC transporter ATP-binding protein n=1 Tax=Virgifigura deserti TaxID=2268457 RepID=UPI000E671736
MTQGEPTVELRRVTLGYGGFIAVKDVDLTVPTGTFVTLLGPSGCGKTTILRAIAGLVPALGGEIIIKGRRVNDVPIHKRNIGLVFQNYALFPHKTVFDNVAFGLKYRGVDKAAIEKRVKRALDVVRLPGVESKLPSELSGGQQQRIALARAVVIEPDVLLLDEPLSALDANLREEMRVELKSIQRTLGITTIFVTHDQEEALALSDCVVVMDHGRIEQAGAPEEVYRWPASRFVADFLGQSNLLPGQIIDVANSGATVRLSGGGEILVRNGAGAQLGQAVETVIRAHRVMVRPPGHETGPNLFDGRVQSVAYLGGMAAYVIEGEIGVHAINTIDRQIFREGDRVQVSIAPEDCVLLDDKGLRIGH